jgi:uncharacterized membrane protein YkvA (DUF1232 family)
LRERACIKEDGMPQAQPPQKTAKNPEPGNGHRERAGRASQPDQPQPLPGNEKQQASDAGDEEQQQASDARHPYVEMLKDKLEQLTKKTRMKHLAKVVAQRSRISKELRGIPSRMQKVTNQAQLVLELVDDFRDDKYRKVSWYTVAIAAASLLYAVSPGDVVPDYIPGLGALDDVLVLGISLRLIKKDLRAYCLFKGYDPEKYF